MFCLNSTPKITQESACLAKDEGPCPQLVFDELIKSQRPMAEQGKRGVTFRIPGQEIQEKGGRDSTMKGGVGTEHAMMGKQRSELRAL